MHPTGYRQKSVPIKSFIIGGEKIKLNTWMVGKRIPHRSGRGGGRKRLSEESYVNKSRYRQKGGDRTWSKRHDSSRCLEGKNSIELWKHVGYYEDILMYKKAREVVGNPNGGVE